MDQAFCVIKDNGIYVEIDYGGMPVMKSAVSIVLSRLSGVRMASGKFIPMVLAILGPDVKVWQVDEPQDHFNDPLYVDFEEQEVEHDGIILSFDAFYRR